MKTIKSKILISMLSLILAIVLVISISSTLSTYNSTLFALEESMEVTATTAASLVEEQLTNYVALAVEFSHDDVIKQVITDPNDPNYAAVNALLEERTSELAARHGFAGVYVLGTDGIVPYTGVNASSRDYFHAARDEGKTHISDPSTNMTTGTLDMFAASPVYNDAGEFIGCVAIGIDPTVFSEIFSEIKAGDGSTAGVWDNTGTYVAHTDEQQVLDRVNLIENAKTDTTLEALAALSADALSGDTGFGEYSLAGMDKFMAYAPVPNSNGWSVFFSVTHETFLAQMNSSIITNIILGVASLFIATCIVSFLSRKISNPIKLCAKRLDEVVSGDLHSPVPEVNTKDETFMLANSTRKLTEMLSIIINDIGGALEEMGEGNLSAQSDAEEYYVGDFSQLYASMDKIQASLSATISQINAVSGQVSFGSQQVASGAQSLAEGAIDQTSSIEQLSVTIETIGGKVAQTADDSQTAKAINNKSHQALEQSQNQMHEMVTAMSNISAKSNEISKIIKAIDDIAFQTNILSLNAAVEAARAGAAGKGFAVVADEVRNLATKSAQSAKDTAALIEETVHVVSIGNKIANSTSESINVAFESANELSVLVDSIATASREQADGAQSITSGISQISAVIQTNSATAEESASASEELSAQAHALKQLVSKFTLAKDYMNDYNIQQPLQQPQQFSALGYEEQSHYMPLIGDKY